MPGAGREHRSCGKGHRMDLQRPAEMPATRRPWRRRVRRMIVITTIVLATGMAKVHTIDEQLKVEDLVKVSELLVEIIRRA